MKVNVDKNKVLASVEYWGSNTPVMAMEECAELISAISRMRRERPGAQQNLYEEIRDVYISLSMLMLHYDISEGMIEEMIDEKLSKKKEN